MVTQSRTGVDVQVGAVAAAYVEGVPLLHPERIDWAVVAPRVLVLHPGARDWLDQFRAGGYGDDWPEPKLIPIGLAEVQPFRPALLPDALRPWIEDIAERAATPPDFAAAAAMVAAASLVGRRVTIRPHPKDLWTVVPHLWGAAIGRSGILKSPTVKEALKPLKRLEVDAADDYAGKLNLFEAEQNVTEAVRKPTKTYIEKQRKLGRALEDIAKEAAETKNPEKPPRRRYMVNDSTYEKLGTILQDNPSGTLVYRDELVGLLRYLDREGQESARAFFLEAWAGDGRYEFNRISRGDTIIANCGLSIFGSIQPGPLRQYVDGTLAGGVAADGLVQRFQLAVWPDAGEEWRYIDRFPDSDARAVAFDAFRGLAGRDPDDVGGFVDQFSPDDPPYLKWDDETHEAFVEWRVELERRIRGGREHPVIESHLAKYRSLLPALALVCHLIDGKSGTLGIEAFTRASLWTKYLESHARRIYGAAMGEDTTAARLLADRLRAREVEDDFTPRDIYRHCWAGLGQPSQVRAALEILIGLDWLRERAVPSGESGGRPTSRHRINPRIWQEDPK